MNTVLDAPPPVAATGERSYYNMTQAATLLGVSRMSIWRWVRAGRLPVSRLGHRTVRIERVHLERLLAETGSAAGGGSMVSSRTANDPSDDSMIAEHVPCAGWRSVAPGDHFVQFYEADDFLLNAVAAYIDTALQAGEAGVVIATASHRHGLEQRLKAEGLDLAAASAGGQYVALDAAEIVAQFTVAGLPQPQRFSETVGAVVARAAAGGRPVRVFGEMVALLADAGNYPAVLGLERLWNDLQTTQAFSLFCAYPMAQLGGDGLAGTIGTICAEHARVIPAESYTALPAADDRLRAIALLQQKAISLETQISEREQTEERLRAALLAEQDARAAAEAALRMRDEFLSIAAHELRTPITSLRGYAQLAQRRLERDGQAAPERVVPALEAVAGQAGKLSRLVDRLLDISRLEAGKLVLDRQPADLAVLVEQVVSSARTWSDQREIVYSSPRSLLALVDPLRLEQVLTNLLDNAIKYSPDGGRIEVTLARSTATAELSVRDFGLGIPPEQRERIFDRFYQAHANGYLSGMGLGLHIAREIVDLHNGTIRAEFPADGGTRLVVTLPVDAQLAERRAGVDALDVNQGSRQSAWAEEFAV
ncbi:MAG TPA: ATP-binding protein [Chloroflexota bacterium]